jgi:hypothetical protein
MPPGIPPTWSLEKCDVCNQTDIKQPIEPVLKYVKGANGRGLSVQCCATCARRLAEEEKAYAAKKAKTRRKAATGDDTGA